MTVPKKKKPASRSASATRSKSSTTQSRKKAAGKARRFWTALLSSASASFYAGTWALQALAGNTAPPDLSLLDALRAVVVTPARTPVATTGTLGTQTTAAPKGATVATRFSECRQFFPAQTPPVVPAAPKLRELCYSNFAILHSGDRKTPVFVAQRLDRKQIDQARGLPRTDRFFADARLPQAERAELGDYRNSGYSRGHMAPAGDMANAEAMAQSFSLANMVPQDQRHNGGAWSQVEQATRQYVQRASGDVYVFTGPVFDGPTRTVGSGHVQVPSHVFKLVYDAQTGRAWAHWHANSPDQKMGAPMGYDELVRRTGIDWMPTLHGAL